MDDQGRRGDGPGPCIGDDSGGYHSSVGLVSGALVLTSGVLELIEYMRAHTAFGISSLEASQRLQSFVTESVTKCNSCYTISQEPR